MADFRTKRYRFSSPKIRGREALRFALLADLHGFSFGEENCLLVKEIQKYRPHAVLAAGDMIVRRDAATFATAKNLLCTLAGEFPVILSPGNHEAGMEDIEDFREIYLDYEASLREMGVQVLKNERTRLLAGETPVIFHGLDLPMEYYHKPNSPRLRLDTLTALLGKREEEGLHVLLAHNPKYGRTYFQWGADLTVCGHYHGGVLRLSERHGLTCPQYLLFPPYCCGDFHRDGRHMVVSPGLGEHTIPIRIHNPRELLIIELENPG